MNSAISSSLCNTTVKELLYDDFNLIYVDEENTLAEVLHVLSTHRILSAPVKSKSNSSFIGIVDSLDIMTALCTKFAKVSLLAEDSYRQMDEFASQKVGNLINISGRNQWKPISYKCTILELIQTLAKRDIHRVPVVNECHDVIGMISQTRILEYLRKNKTGLDKYLKLPALSGKGKVLSIHMSEFVLTAFQKMWDESVSGIAIIDNDGILRGNISSGDLRRLKLLPIGELAHQLYQPLKQFLNIRVTVEDRVNMAYLPKFEPFCIADTASVEQALDACCEKRTHRVYVVDSHQRPVDVLALRDILLKFAQEPQPMPG